MAQIKYACGIPRALKNRGLYILEPTHHPHMKSTPHPPPLNMEEDPCI